MITIKPKKSLGQHFLSDKNIAAKITRSLTFKGYDKVIEIGPGTGMLTGFLLENRNIDLTLIEIDGESVKYLKERFPGFEDKIFEGDFLRYPLARNFSSPVALIGNFPYNISSQIFFRILETKHLVREVVCMVQKEVAKRIVAGPGSKIYGILSVLLQTYYQTEYLFSVPPQVFVPAPKVKSAVIRLTLKIDDPPGCNENLLFRIVKTAFNQRRKMLRNSLSGLIGQLKIKELEKNDPKVNFSSRPEQLSVEDFINLTNLVESQSG